MSHWSYKWNWVGWDRLGMQEISEHLSLVNKNDQKGLPRMRKRGRHQRKRSSSDKFQPKGWLLKKHKQLLAPLCLGTAHFNRRVRGAERERTDGQNWPGIREHGPAGQDSREKGQKSSWQTQIWWKSGGPLGKHSDLFPKVKGWGCPKIYKYAL